MKIGICFENSGPYTSQEAFVRMTAPIIGPRTTEQLDEAPRSAEIKLSTHLLEKLDKIFPGPGGLAPEGETLTAIDAHFWDWVLWLRAKEARGKGELVRAELLRLHEHLLGPLGLSEPPSSIGEAIAMYQKSRDDAERRFGCQVSRRLEAEVAPAVS